MFLSTTIGLTTLSIPKLLNHEIIPGSCFHVTSAVSVSRNYPRREEGKEDLKLTPAACATYYTRKRKKLVITWVEIPKHSLTSVR